MGLFDRWKKRSEEEEQASRERLAFLEKLSSGSPIFTDHESDIEFQQEYEKELEE